jgi:hypothetical protein
VSTDHRAELNDITHRVLAENSEIAHRNLFWSEISSNVVMPLLLRNLAEIDLEWSEPMEEFGAPVLGFISAAFILISGTQHLTDRATHRPIVTQVKGLVKVLQSMQVVTTQSLILAGAAFLGPPTLAAGVGLHFALSLDDTLYAYRRLDRTYWLTDTKAMMLKNEQRLLELEQLMSTAVDEKTRDVLQKKWYKLVETQTQLSAHVHEAEHGQCETIDHENKEKFYHAFSKSFILGMLFSGAVLLCIPGLQVPGLIILTAAIAVFLIKNSPNLLRKAPTEMTPLPEVHAQQRQVMGELLNNHTQEPGSEMTPLPEVHAQQRQVMGELLKKKYAAMEEVRQQKTQVLQELLSKELSIKDSLHRIEQQPLSTPKTVPTPNNHTQEPGSDTDSLD